MTGPRGVPPSAATARPDAADLFRLWELSLDILALVAPDGTFLQVNPSFTRVLGWPRDEVIGRTAYDFVHPADAAQTLAGFEQMGSPGELVASFENRYLTRDGEYRTLQWNARTGMDGDVIHAVARDVSPQRDRMQALQLSEERFRLAMGSAAIGMAMVGLDGRFLEVNDALCRIVGRPRDVLTTLTFPDITHPEDLDADVGLAAALLAGEIDHYDLEKRYVHADGSEVRVLLTGSLVRDGEGVPQHFIAQVQDIGDRRDAEEALARAMADLRQSNQTLAEFAAVAAHDLKSPLAVATAAVETVTLRYADGLAPAAVDLLERTSGHLRRLAHQVDGLLRIAALAGRPLDLEPVALADVVHDVTTLLADTLATVEVVVDTDDTVLADRAAVGLLLQNLLANAAIHGGRQVRVHSRVEDGQVWVAVDDDGPGIPVEDRDHVFEPFASSRPEAGSTGLGLALCRRIVGRHGGEIAIRDAPLGGARVELSLPDGSEARDLEVDARGGRRR